MEVSATFRLLLVEDNAGDADLVGEWLADARDFSFEIELVATLADAIATLERRAYDGIILDLNLPDSAGIDTLRRLVCVAHDVPIIVFSGTDDPDLRLMAEAEGVLHVITKDETPARLLTRSALDIVKRSSAGRTDQQFENLVSVMPDAVIVTTLDGVVQFINPAAKELFGRDSEELMGERIGFAVKEGHVSEIEVFRADEQRFAEIRVAHCIWDRRPACLAMIRDITDRKRLSEQLRLMVNELNHRVKNSLATVQGIAAQSLRDAKPLIEAREAFMHRLFAFAKTHDVLTECSWAGATLEDVVDAAINFLQDNDRTRIQMHGPSVRLTPRAALVFSLVMHELATNAVKYGALSNDAGHVHLAWRLTPADGPAPRLSLSWREANGPPVAPPTRRGFGSRLIQGHLAVELNGVVNCDYAPAGFVCSIDVPYAAPASAGDADCAVTRHGLAT